MSLRRKVVSEPVYSLFHGNFPSFDLFSECRYIRVMEKGPEDSLFGLT